MGRFQFDHTGPFEPLVLSLPGEDPVIQVFMYIYALILLSQSFVLFIITMLGSICYFHVCMFWKVYIYFVVFFFG